MFSKEELDTAAKTLMSMCTDYLTRGLTEGTFRMNLKMFADLANEPVKKKVFQSDDFCDYCKNKDDSDGACKKCLGYWDNFKGKSFNESRTLCNNGKCTGLPDTDDFYKDDNSTPSEGIKLYGNSIKKRIDRKISKSCETCNDYGDYDGPCFNWPKCSLTYDKWSPKKSITK